MIAQDVRQCAPADLDDKLVRELQRDADAALVIALAAAHEARHAAAVPPAIAAAVKPVRKRKRKCDSAASAWPGIAVACRF